MSHATARLAFLASCLVFAASAALAAPPVAIVTDVRGDAKESGAGRVSFLAEISPATILVMERGAHVTLMYTATGTEFILTGPGEFLVEASEVKAVKGVAPARRNVTVRPDSTVVARVAQSATASLRMRGLAPASPASKAPGPAYPRDTKVASLQPVLRWHGSASGAQALVVTDSDDKVVWRATTTGRSARMSVKLRPASRYRWSVFAGTAILGEAAFETLPTEAIAKAEKSRAAAKSFSDRAVHAILLQDLGAAQDARAVWAGLARERPEFPEPALLAR